MLFLLRGIDLADWQSIRQPGLDEYVEERAKLISMAQSLVGDRSIAEELVQDSWLRWQEQGYPEKAASSIFPRIVRNLAMDWLRHRKVETRWMVQQEPSISAAPESERIAIVRQDVEIAASALAELPERTRKAFRLSRVDGLTYAQIGDRLCVSAPRAHQMVRRAVMLIAVRLEESGAP
ncbi:MAG: sigma-70 family RNA polymerase sigma factor [Pseudomonadota bacterium]